MTTHLTVGIGHDAEDRVNEMLSKAIRPKHMTVLEVDNMNKLGDALEDTVSEIRAITANGIITGMDVQYFVSIQQQLSNWIMGAK